tara:strand:- start:384 stop:503 length:120 start_codon:yes stop_codon:yes gene_type:complete
MGVIPYENGENLRNNSNPISDKNPIMMNLYIFFIKIPRN